MKSGIAIRTFLFLQCLLLGVVVVYFFFMHPARDGDVYLQVYLKALGLLCFSAMLIATIYCMRSAPEMSFKKEWKDLLMMLVLGIIAGWVRFAGLESYDSWFDEDNQIQLLLRDLGPLTASIRSFQSPLDYIFNYMLFQKVGVDMFTARAWSATMGTLVVPFAYMLARSGIRIWIAALVGLLCAFHPWLLAYSRECRPYIGSVLVFAFTLQWMWWAWDGEKQKYSWLGFATSMTVLFYYLAILPMIMFGILGLVLLFSWKQKREFVQRYWISFILAAGAWLPHYLMMAGYHQVGDKTVSILQIYPYRYMECILSALSGSAVGLLLVAWAALRKKINSVARPLMVLALVYPLGMLFFSSPGVHRYFVERFVLLYAFLVLLVIGYALEEVEAAKRAWWLRGIFFIGVIVLAGHFVVAPSVKLEEKGWKEAYKIFDQEPEAGGVAAVFSPTPMNQFGNSGFLGQGVFFHPNEKISMSMHGSTHLNQAGTLIKALHKNNSPPYVYLFSFRPQLTKIWQTLPLTESISIKRYTLSQGNVLLRIDTRGDSLLKLQSFFQSARNHHGDPQIDGRYQEVLLGLALLRKQCDEARKYEKLFSIPMYVRADLRTRDHLKKMFSEECGSQEKNEDG